MQVNELVDPFTIASSFDEKTVLALILVIDTNDAAVARVGSGFRGEHRSIGYSAGGYNLTGELRKAIEWHKTDGATKL